MNECHERRRPESSRETKLRKRLLNEYEESGLQLELHLSRKTMISHIFKERGECTPINEGRSHIFSEIVCTLMATLLHFVNRFSFCYLIKMTIGLSLTLEYVRSQLTNCSTSVTRGVHICMIIDVG